MCFKKVAMLIGLIGLIAGCGTIRVNPTQLPEDLRVAQNVTMPSDTVLGIYVPANYLNSFFRKRYTAERVSIGGAFQEAMASVAPQFFQEIFLVEFNPKNKFGLLLDIDPKWSYEDGKIDLVLNYNLIDTQQRIIHQGVKTYREKYNFQKAEDTFFNVSVRALQQVFVDIVNEVAPTGEDFPAIAKASSVNPEMLINADQPVSKVTGFKLNREGQVLTSYADADGCLVTKIELDEKLYDVKTIANSLLLDLAVLDAQVVFNKYLSFSADDKRQLGEAMVSVSYSNKSEEATSSMLSVGNVNSQAGIKGSLGVFQFASAVAPVSSGGAVLNENGRVIGVVSGGFNTKYLEENGHIPKNVYFALGSEHVKKFLELNDIAYDAGPSNTSASSTESALNNSVQINCYQ